MNVFLFILTSSFVVLSFAKDKAPTPSKPTSFNQLRGTNVAQTQTAEDKLAEKQKVADLKKLEDEFKCTTIPDAKNPQGNSTSCSKTLYKSKE